MPEGQCNVTGRKDINRLAPGNEKVTYSEAIRSGFRLVNRNLQLVAIQAGLMLANCVGFFVIVMIPLVMAFVVFGFDLAGLRETGHLFNTLQNTPALLSKYFGLVLVVLTSFLIYIVAAAMLWLFVFGGAAGVIGRSIVEPSRKFSMKGFLAEARRLFAPLLWYALLIGLMLIAAAFVMSILSGGASAVVSVARTQDSTLALFLGIFFSLVLILIGLSLILGILATAVYGVSVIYFKEKGTARSLKITVGYLWDHPEAFWLYVLLLCGYVLASFVLVLVVYPFNIIPFVGPLISFPFRILSYLVQGYLGLVITGITFSYYHSSHSKSGEDRGKDKPEQAFNPADESSIGPEDTSPFQDPGPEIPPS